MERRGWLIGTYQTYVWYVNNEFPVKKLIAQTTDAIEGFVNFGCIATGILQILALNFHKLFVHFQY